MKTVAQTLVDWLKLSGVDTVFGIPGVHTIELYRALAGSGIRHIMPRHEAGAGFMADGYARVSGRFGVALVITGPGVTNILTPMAQARGDSVPMLVISTVNPRDSLGKGLGELHELPDQRALTRTLGPSFHLDDPKALPGLLAGAGRALTTGRGQPVHVEIPLDLMTALSPPAVSLAPATGSKPDLAKAKARIRTAKAPVILAGGGCRRAGPDLAALADAMGAPVVLTVNARGLMHGHPLAVPYSPSLAAVRDLVRGSDLVLAVGTELGATDYDMNKDGGFPDLTGMIRIDIDGAQLMRHRGAITLLGDTAAVLPGLAPAAPVDGGVERAQRARDRALASLSAAYRADLSLLNAIRDALPAAILVGDSTQICYAGNMGFDPARPGGWFNAATGYGALGFATGAAVGAALADPSARVVSLCGDGGLMFHPGELGTAVDAGLDIAFVVFNNHGYGEIAQAMIAARTEVIGCTPKPPDFEALARAFGLRFDACSDSELPYLLASGKGPRLIEVARPKVMDYSRLAQD